MKKYLIAFLLTLSVACFGQLKISQYPNTASPGVTFMFILADTNSVPGTNWNYSFGSLSNFTYSVARSNAVWTDNAAGHVELINYPETASFSTNQSLVNLGDFAGLDQAVTNSVGVHNWGRLAGVQQTVNDSQGIDSFSIGAGFLRDVRVSTNILAIGADSGELGFLTNVTDALFLAGGGDTAFIFDSGQISMIGREAGGDSVIHNSANLHFQNSFSGAHADLDGVGNTDFGGFEAGQYFLGRNSTDLQFRGTQSGDHAVAINCNDLIYDSVRAGYTSSLTNSSHVYFLGASTGVGITGSYSNVTFLGAGATANPSTNRLVLGDMSITTGDPGSGTAEWKLGKVITGASVTLTTTNFLEITVDGVVKKVALVQ